MQIVFANNDVVDLILDSTPVAAVYRQIYKHLQYVPVPFRDWDNPFYREHSTHQYRVEQLAACASRLGVEIDQVLCHQQDQSYLNSIHRIYETNYHGDPAWLDFHEHIHLCEKRVEANLNFLQIDYREKSGQLERPFDPQWMQSATTRIRAGDVFVRWSELGKSPYSYWKDQEPDDTYRMHELAKPWLRLRPKIMVALDDMDFLQDIDVEDFESWWAPRQLTWCQHWNIPNWTVHDIFGVVVFGRAPDHNKITAQLKNNQMPLKVLL